MIHDLLVEAYDQYTTYLASYPLLLLPHRTHVEAPNYVYVSSLGMCPLKAALERRKIQPKYPDLLPENAVWKRHLMEQGKRDAAVLQEAIIHQVMYAKRPRLFSGCEIEHPAVSDELKLKGRIDAMLSIGIGSGDDSIHLIEIKRRDLPKNGGVLAPKLTDIYQVMGYGLITGHDNLHVVLMNRYFFSTWSLKKEGQGFLVVDNLGREWDHPNNTPNHLNYEMLKVEIERQHAYLRGERTATPIPDPLNDETGYLCVSTVRYANKAPGSKGRVKLNCGYFCWDSDSEIETMREADGSLSWDVPFTAF